LTPKNDQQGIVLTCNRPSFPNHATFQSEIASATAEKMDERRQLFMSFFPAERLKVDYTSGKSLDFI
jgi:hypothetical protein